MTTLDEIKLAAFAEFGIVTGTLNERERAFYEYVLTGGLSGGSASALNPLINGDFAVCQRTLGPATVDTYTFDRWYLSGVACNVSIGTFSSNQTSVPGFPSRYAVLERDASGEIPFFNVIEGCQTFAGQTITVSFYANSDAEDNEITVFWRQDFGTGGSTTVETTPQTVTITQGAWTRYSVTITVPSVAGKTIGANNYAAPVFNLGSGQFAIGTEFNLANVQIDIGTSASDWRPQDYALTYYRCQRYYRFYDNGYSCRSYNNVGASPITQTFTLTPQMYSTPSWSVSGGTNVQATTSQDHATANSIGIAMFATTQVGVMSIIGADLEIDAEIVP